MFIVLEPERVRVAGKTFVLLIALVLYPVAPRFFREAEAGGILKKFLLMGIAIIGIVVIAISSS